MSAVPPLGRHDLKMSPLHEAAASGKASLCRSYLAQGMDPRTVDAIGRTPGDLARLHGHRSVARMLEDACTAADITISIKLTPLSIRELHGLTLADGNMVDRLISDGRLAASDAKGNSPLHIAARLGNMLLCDRMVQAGADPSQHNKAGETPAESAETAGHAELARLLRTILSHAEPPPIDADSLSAPSPIPPVRPSVIGVRASTQKVDELPEFDVEVGAMDFHHAIRGSSHSADIFRVQEPAAVRSGFGEEAADWDFASDEPTIPNSAIERVDEAEKTDSQPEPPVRSGAPIEQPSIASIREPLKLAEPVEPSVGHDRLDHAVACLLAGIPEALAITLRMLRRIIGGRLSADFVLKPDIPTDDLVSAVDVLENWQREKRVGLSQQAAEVEVLRLGLRDDYVVDLLEVVEETNGMEQTARLLSVGIDRIRKAFPTRTKYWWTTRQ